MPPVFFLLFLFAVSRGIESGKLPEGFTKVKLIGISYAFSDFTYRQRCVGQKLPGLVDPDISQIFQRSVSLVAVKNLCEICGCKPHG